ncbi:hypothetical protein CBR_g49661 [Chara braunii]|uniref:SOUL heme-binding protein n=1 Tax=Chara braunii TaxID=69332 RepID=A0A388M5J2_CHABU|nr:hypothetical protein CBR_g49661 [Chara braunii]|eukprot:GBG89810.1 hypothetical protein CBR_g49661 [Chara braunii]
MGMAVGKIREETPKYTVIHKAESFEVREYEPAMAAAVEYPGDIYLSDNKSNPFMVLAGYIGVLTSPKNVKAEAIAMTAPVVMVPPSASSASSSSPPSAKLSDGGSGTGKAEGEKIAMTAPVVMQPTPQLVVGTTGGGGEAGESRDSSSPSPSSPSSSPSASSAQSAPPAESSSMMFILPSKYTSLDMVPKPTDPRVTIVELPRRKLAVIRFSGIARKEVSQEKEEQLLQAVAKAGFKVAGKPSLMLYNPPFTLPMFRTNEVSVAVE